MKLEIDVYAKDVNGKKGVLKETLNDDDILNLIKEIIKIKYGPKNFKVDTLIVTNVWV